MKMRAQLIITLLAVVGLVPTGFLVPVQATALSISDIAIPSESNVSWVATELQHNGVPMQIQKFTSALSVEDVLNFYRNRWAPLGDTFTPGYVENTVGGWSVISMLETGNSVVVQLRPGVFKATEGFISSVDPEVAPQNPAGMLDIPIPEGADVISRTSSEDLENTGQTTVLSSQKRVSEMYEFYKRRMPQSGWRLSTASDQLDTAVLLYSKKNVFCEISISPSDTGVTILMINRVSARKNG